MDQLELMETLVQLESQVEMGLREQRVSLETQGTMATVERRDQPASLDVMATLDKMEKLEIRVFVARLDLQDPMGYLEELGLLDRLEKTPNTAHAQGELAPTYRNTGLMLVALDYSSMQSNLL